MPQQHSTAQHSTAQHSNRRVQCPRHAAISSPRLAASQPVAPPWPWRLFPPAPSHRQCSTETFVKPLVTSLRSMLLSTDFTKAMDMTPTAEVITTNLGQ